MAKNIRDQIMQRLDLVPPSLLAPKLHDAVAIMADLHTDEETECHSCGELTPCESLREVAHSLSIAAEEPTLEAWMVVEQVEVDALVSVLSTVEDRSDVDLARAVIEAGWYRRL